MAGAHRLLVAALLYQLTGAGASPSKREPASSPPKAATLRGSSSESNDVSAHAATANRALTTSGEHQSLSGPVNMRHGDHRDELTALTPAPTPVSPLRTLSQLPTILESLPTTVAVESGDRFLGAAASNASAAKSRRTATPVVRVQVSGRAGDALRDMLPAAVEAPSSTSVSSTLSTTSTTTATTSSATNTVTTVTTTATTTATKTFTTSSTTATTTATKTFTTSSTATQRTKSWTTSTSSTTTGTTSTSSKTSTDATEKDVDTAITIDSEHESRGFPINMKRATKTKTSTLTPSSSTWTVSTTMANENMTSTATVSSTRSSVDSQNAVTTHVEQLPKVVVQETTTTTTTGHITTEGSTTTRLTVSYEILQSGVCAAHITTISECSYAATALALSDTTAIADGRLDSSTPPYCYMSNNFGLRFNSGGDNIGLCSKKNKCLCRQVPGSGKKHRDGLASFEHLSEPVLGATGDGDILPASRSNASELEPPMPQPAGGSDTAAQSSTSSTSITTTMTSTLSTTTTTTTTTTKSITRTTTGELASSTTTVRTTKVNEPALPEPATAETATNSAEVVITVNPARPLPTVAPSAASTSSTTSATSTSTPTATATTTTTTTQTTTSTTTTTPLPPPPPPQAQVSKTVATEMASLDPQGQIDSLWEHLSATYHREMPPVPRDGQPLKVGVGINFVKFREFDEVAGTMSIAANLRLFWQDGRLSFNAKKFFNRSWDPDAGDKLPIRADLIWTPDVTIMNQVGDQHQLLAKGSSPLEIADDAYSNKTGVNVLWSRPVDVQSNCEVDMSEFPFDTQQCVIAIGCWASSDKWLQLEPQTSYQENTCHTSEFRVKDIKFEKKKVASKGVGAFNEVQYHIVLHRYPHYYVINFILPMLAITLLTVATMWMSSDNMGQRINGGAKLFLCVVSIMFLTARHRPAMRGDIWMDRFTSHCLFSGMASVLESLCIDFLAKRYQSMENGKDVAIHVDSLLRTVIVLMSTFLIFNDAYQVKRYRPWQLYASFQQSSSLYIAGFVYFLLFGLLLSAAANMLWGLWLLYKRLAERFGFLSGSAENVTTLELCDGGGCYAKLIENGPGAPGPQSPLSPRESSGDDGLQEDADLAMGSCDKGISGTGSTEGCRNNKGGDCEHGQKYEAPLLPAQADESARSQSTAASSTLESRTFEISTISLDTTCPLISPPPTVFASPI